MAGIRFDGLATGMDTTALIKAFLDLERRPLQLMQARQSEMSQRQELFRSFNTRLLALADAARALDNQNETLTGATLDEEFLAFSVQSSSEAIVTAEANGNASTGSVGIRVDALAQAARRVSQGFASQSDVIAAEGTALQIAFGGAAPIDTTIAAGGASLADLKDLINSDANNGGAVRAEILFDGSAYRLVVSGKETGAVNDVAITTDIAGPGATAFLDTNLGQDAQDARIQVLGIPITRPDNVITDAVPGLTLRLHAAHAASDPTASARLDIARDDGAIETKLKTFVDAYNAIHDFTAQQSSFNEKTKTAGALSGDSTLRRIESDLQQTLVQAFSFAGNPIGSLGQIGVNFDREGRLSLDSARLREALDEDSAGVRELLAGDGASDGVATATARILESMTDAEEGLIATRNDGYSERIAEMQKHIDRMEERMALREEALVAQFSRLESLISRIKTQSNYLTSLANLGA